MLKCRLHDRHMATTKLLYLPQTSGLTANTHNCQHCWEMRGSGNTVVFSIIAGIYHIMQQGLIRWGALLVWYKYGINSYYCQFVWMKLDLSQESDPFINIHFSGYLPEVEQSASVIANIKKACILYFVVG